MYKQRDLEKTLLESLDNRRISIILGPRQTGKTSLLKRLKAIINYQGIFLDLDIYENKSIFSSYSELITYLKFNGYNEKDRFILYLDEFHTVEGIDKILKNIYDNHSNIKIFATGSSSLEIVSYLKESLAGRKTIYYLYPLSFEEFVYFKDEDLGKRFRSMPGSSIPKTVKLELNNYVKEFCIFGGYPEVVLTQTPESKKEVLRDIFDLFVKKDLLGFLKIKNPQAALNILRSLAINAGGIINYSELCTINHVDINTLKRYLNILSETFIIELIRPYYSNKNKEVVKSPKAYFYDPGARNYFIKNFAGFESRVDNSFLIENFVFCQLIKKSDFLTQIKYWRDKNRREVDFIVEREMKIMAYEVKYKKIIKKRELSNLLYFHEIYNNSQLIIVNQDDPKLAVEGLNYAAYFEI
ncbi:MAG: ATP-binding protein [bacterium]